MKNLHETKQRIFALNEKRTHDAESYSLYCTCGGDAQGGLEFQRYKYVTDADMDFIAAAPDAVEVMRAQDELLRECLQGLTFHYSLNRKEPRMMATESLIDKLKAALGESEG